MHKAHVILHSDDIVTEDTLRRLAGELGDEWQVLGPCLNVKRTRIQAILRNNALNGEGGEDEAKFDMLMTWAKTVPKSMNKVYYIPIIYILVWIVKLVDAIVYIFQFSMCT